MGIVHYHKTLVKSIREFAEKPMELAMNRTARSKWMESNHTWFNQFHIYTPSKQLSCSISINWMTTSNACPVCVCRCRMALQMWTMEQVGWFNTPSLFFLSRASISCVHFIVFWHHKFDWCERETERERLRLVVCLHCLATHVDCWSKQIIPIQYSVYNMYLTD